MTEIAIIGPGAVGKFLTANFAADGNNKVHLYGKSGSPDASEIQNAFGIKYTHVGGQSTIVREGEGFNFHYLPVAQGLNADLIFVTVRTPDLTKELAEQVKKLSSPGHTKVVVLANGIMPVNSSFDGIDGIRNIAEFKSVMNQNGVALAFGNSRASCNTSGYAEVAVSNPQYGVTLYPSGDEDINDIADTIKRSGLAVHPFSPEEAVRGMLTKLSFSSAPLAAIFGFTMQELATNGNGQALLKESAKKFYEIAEVNGVSNLDHKNNADEYAEYVVEANESYGSNRYAMLNALLQGKKTETEACVEAVCSLAEKKHIDAGIFRHANRAITATEACVQAGADCQKLNEKNRQTLQNNKEKSAAKILELVATDTEEELKKTR